MASVLFPSSSPKRPLRNVNANGLMLADGEGGLQSFCPCSLSELFKLAPGSYLWAVWASCCLLCPLIARMILSVGLKSLRARGKVMRIRKTFPQESGQEWLKRRCEPQLCQGHLNLLLPSKRKHCSAGQNEGQGVFWRNLEGH